MKRYTICAALFAVLLTGCGGYTEQNAAADIAAEQNAAEQIVHGVVVTDDAGRTGYYDSNGIFIPDPSNSGRAEFDEPAAETHTEAADVQEQNPAETGPYNTEDWYVLPWEEYFSVFGIRPLPETIGSYTLQQWATDARFDIRERTAFQYTGEDGSEGLTVYISAESEFEIGEDQILLHHAEENSIEAEFTVYKAHITMLSKETPVQDIDKLAELAKELKSYLVIQ